MDESPATRHSLIVKLRDPADSAAWREFMTLYEPLIYRLARRKGLTIALVRRMNEVYERAIGLVARGRVDTSSLVTDQFGLAATADAFATATKRAGLKVVVEPNR